MQDHPPSCFISIAMKPLPLLLLSFTIFSFSAESAATRQLPPQLRSLIAIKASLEDPQLSFSDWDIGPALSGTNRSDFYRDPVWCSWSGIKCASGTSEIISINLSGRNLSGKIPAEIRYLTSLLHLNLSRNSFRGPFPQSIYELEKLRTLDISHNSFNSTFPPGISRLKSLRVFDAYSNDFQGALPAEIMHLRFLENLNLGGSYFEEEIPASYGGLSRLKYLHLAGNLLKGSLPPKLGLLQQLEHLEIGYNQFKGRIPVEFASLSNLKYLDISNCSLSGALPHELGNLSKLESLDLFHNKFTGEIPESYSRLKALKSLDLSVNQLVGKIPEGFSDLKELTWLGLEMNNLSGEIPAGIGELPNLNTLLLWDNNLTGILPQKLGSNGKLFQADVSSNSLSGPVPPNLCYGNKLFKLILFANQLDGELPRGLVNCTTLWRLRIQNNRLNGTIPYGFGSLPNLTYVDLSQNRFDGEIPSDLSAGPMIQYVNISENSFNSSLPRNIWRSPRLQVFAASFSALIGEIPEFIGCRGLYRIELQGNSLEGPIPWDIGHCEKLIWLNLSRNRLTGIIPWEISAIPSISNLDLSHNKLNGTIPSDFGNCSTLETFNVSYNNLTGPVPSSSSIFSNIHPSSFSGNEGLCGGVLPKPCPASVDQSDLGRGDEPRARKTAGAIVWIVAAAFGVGLFILVGATRCFHANYGHHRRSSHSGDPGPWKLTAFQRLSFTAEDVLNCLSVTDTILGMGSTGAVYKAKMPGGEIIAVKKLWGPQKEGRIRRRRGVLAEVDVLGNVRHRNIVRLLGCCSNRESTMLLYEYMPNGNLEDMLHGTKHKVGDWVTRYKIALGVAQGICYLHHDCSPVIVHRDLKPSNILLDDEMEARVADFGVAKLIQTDESMSVIAGSYGYIAPEYAYTLQVDEKSDIYSFGVVLMEILSGKRSVDPEFGDGNSIVDWVRSRIKMRDGVDEILDKNAGASCSTVREEMKQMLRISLLCTSRNPSERPSMRDVVMMIQEAEPKRKLPESEGGDEAKSQKVTVEC